MVRFSYVICILFMIIGCSYNRNIYKKIRVKESRFHIKPNNNNLIIYNLIDTSYIYKLMSIYDSSKNIEKLNTKQYHFNMYLKFYKNGRLGIYYIKKDSLINSNSFNPQKADMVYYNLKNNDLIFESYNEHVNGDFFSMKKISIKNDSLIITNYKGSEGFKYIYSKQKNIPSKWYENWKPDW